jgi:hypothetical protein
LALRADLLSSAALPSRSVTPASLLRRALAERIAPAYASNAGVVALFVGGSTARGHADQFSDLEVGVIWATPPTDADRRNAIGAAGGDLVWLYPVEQEAGPVWADAWKIGRRGESPFTGVEVDMHHFLAATVEKTLSDVVDAFDPDVMKQSLVGAILTGMPLLGPELVQSWQRRAATYPDQLRVAVVGAHAQIEGLWRLDAYCARGNPVAGYGVLTGAHEELLHTLLGLNRVYFSGLKSLEAVTADLEIAPRDLLDRVRATYPLRLGTSKQRLTALVEETYDLIAKHLPQIDVERLRGFLRYERPLWDDPADPGSGP